MSSRTFDGNPETAGPGFCPAPPPPPPPPVPGQAPALRINTVEAPVPRRSLPNSNNNPYEPPAAIQNAMMTKDKKPFTYTPGMGGKLDLSQIRSPRMARRVAKNANDEGIEGPPKSSLAAEPRPVSAAPNLYIQPQVAVPVFPTNVPLQPSVNRNSVAPPSRVPSNASDRGVEIQRPVTRVETKLVPQVVSPQPTPPETPTTPPQVTLAKAPTPWLQNKNKPQEELPEWAKRSSVIRPSSSTSPESPGSQTAQIQILQAQPQVLQSIQLQQTPAMQTRQQQPQQQPPPPQRQQSQPHERVIPLRIEDRPSVFTVKNEAGHHQFKQQQQQQQPQPSPHHQQRWGNATPPQTPIQAQVPQFQNQQQYQQPPRPQSSGGGTYIVPIMVEGSSSNGPSAASYNQQPPIRSQPVQNQSPRVIVQRGPPSPQIQQQGEPGPVQSRSFRVLQKITDTDVPDEVDGEQLRKLQLTEDDKILMNKFKEQVDGDGTYLHQEEDPRYRGAAIPSRAFRFLQNMTDSGDVTTTANAPRAPSAINKRQNRNSRTFEESQANLPASEQQAPEPKKYTGSAIPSRSFRILQAMTSPESIAKQENRQAVIICRTETSMQPGNQQQGVFLSSSSPHDSSSQPLVQQSQLPSQFHASQLQSSQLPQSQSHHSQSSDIPSSQLQYEPQSSQIQSHSLQSQTLELSESQTPQSAASQMLTSQLQPSTIQLTETQSSQLQDTQLPQSQLPELQLSQSQPSQTTASQLQASQMQSLQSQPVQLQLPELQLSRSHPSQMKLLQLQPSQMQLAQLQSLQLQDSQSQQSQLPELQLSESHPSQLQASQMQSLQSQPMQLQASQMHSMQLQLPQLQQSQMQLSQLPPLPPPFWQHPDGSCWWGYYPVHYPTPPNATTSSSSSSSSSSSTSANNHPPHNMPPMQYENYAYHNGCHHHQDGNAFAYYHPFYDQRLYAAATAAAISAATATGIPSCDADAAQRCTDLSSTSSSSSLNMGTLTEASNVLVSEDSSSSSQLIFASTPSTTILHQAACLVPAFIHHQPTKTLPGYDSNCNPCLERTERSCAGDTSIFRSPPVFVQKSANPTHGVPGCRGMSAWTKDQEQGTRNSWISQNPALTELGPPPWIQSNENSSLVNNNGSEVVETDDKSAFSVGQANEVGWNLDGTIGTQRNSAVRQFDEQFVGTKLEETKTDEQLEMEKPRWNSNNVEVNQVDQRLKEAEPKWNRHNGESDDAKLSWSRNGVEANQADQNLEEAKPRWSRNNVEANHVDQDLEKAKSRWSRNNVEANQADQKLEEAKPRWSRNNVEANQANHKLEEAKPRWSRNNVESNQADQKLEVAKPRWIKNNVESNQVDEPQWNRIDNASRNLSETDQSIQMNILHDERNVNVSPVVDKVKNSSVQSLKRSDGIDATDSDSETDSPSRDSSVDAGPVCTDPATNTEEDSDTESDSDDSDSYLAYSTGLNPHEKFAKQSSVAAIANPDVDFGKSQTATTASEDTFDERSCGMSSDKLNSTDCESCVEEDEETEAEEARTKEAQSTDVDNSKAEEIAPHRLSVIPEDHEQIDRGGASPNTIGSDGWQNIPEEHNDSATVSISLPLRFRFSASKNEDEDIAQSKSTVEAEDIATDVCVNLKLAEDTDTTADFTLKKNILRETKIEDDEEDDGVDFWKTEDTSSPTENSDEKKIESEEEKTDNEKTHDTNEDMTSNTDSKNMVNQDDCIDFWETITSGRVTPELNYTSKRERGRIDKYSWGETDLKEEEEEEEEENVNSGDDEENIKEETSPCLKVDDSRCSEEEDDDEEEETDAEEGPEEETMQMSEPNEDQISLKKGSTPLFELTEAKNDDNEESSGRSNLENSKHLLSVQNSRDETDDEDSGVTSDMSRLISEVDTDSECGPTRKINSYKRTQTHSRLFRLLSREDDCSPFSEETRNNSSRRDRLSLPLKNAGFSYDESHHCSNYSSGLTSPDYSPVYEGTWRRLHGEENGTTEKSLSPGASANEDENTKSRKDSYYENWKKTVNDDKIKEETVANANAFKTVDSSNGRALPNWRFRTNVLCPRIKSTKNVPRTVRNARSAKPVISSSSTSRTVGTSNDNSL